MRLSIIIGFLLFLPSFSYSAPPEQDVFSSSLSGQSAGSYYALNVIQTLGSGHTGLTDSLTLYAESSGVDGVVTNNPYVVILECTSSAYTSCVYPTNASSSGVSYFDIPAPHGPGLMTATFPEFAFDPSSFYAFKVFINSTLSVEPKIYGSASSTFPLGSLDCSLPLGTCYPANASTLLSDLYFEFNNKLFFPLIPSDTPWVQINQPSGSYTSVNVPYSIQANTGTTTVDTLVIQVSSSFQTFPPLSFPITASGISTFTGTFTFPPLNDIPTITATLWQATTTAYASSSRTFQLLVEGSGLPQSYDPNQLYIPPTSEQICVMPENPGWADYIFVPLCTVFSWVLIPSPEYIEDLSERVASTSIPFLAQAYSAFDTVISWTETSSSSPVSSLSISLVIPEADLDVEMFSPALLTQGMGTTTKTTFRAIAQISLWIYGFYFVIVWVSAHILGMNMEARVQGSPVIKQ